MKPHHLLPVLLCAILGAALSSPAAVPLRWTVETSRLQPVVFDAVRGETLALEATFQSYGKPLQMTNSLCSIFWQTNGMASAWWIATAAANSNRVSALFTPQMDPGSSVIHGFLGSTGEIYRAAFTIRYRHGPGATPNALENPVKVLDLEHTIVINEPWPTRQDFAATTTVMRAELKNYVDEQIESAGLVTPQAVTNISSSVTSNIVTKSYVEGLGISGGGVDTNSVKSIIESEVGGTNAVKAAVVDVASIKSDYTTHQSATNAANAAITNAVDGGYLCTVEKAEDMTNGVARLSYYGGLNLWHLHGRVLNAQDILFSTGTTPLSLAWYIDNVKANKATTLDGYGITDAYPKSSGVSLQNQVSAIGAHLNAEDAHFVSTNYDSSVNIPEAYVEIKINNTWIKIWKEMTRWTKFVGNAFDWNSWGGFYTWMTNVTEQLSFKADRCWGIYDSETGGYSPEGYTQISSPNILIAANMAYQRTITSGGSVWILQCNTGTAHIGGDTNGFFRIQDGEGVTQFEIINGDKQELGADADGITVDNSTTPSTVTIPYSVEAAEHPVLKICDDLRTAEWASETDAQCIANVSWSGTNRAYVATVQRKTAGEKLFVKATYMSEGETYIHNIAPVGMDSIILNGTKYYLGTAVISGNTVLTLSTTP